jgi:ActR/RegA family two-component response regulator
VETAMVRSSRKPFGLEGLAQKTVLYFHDDQASVQQLQKFLQELFGKLLIADSDFALLKLLRSAMPDFVVADLAFCTGQDLLVFEALRQIDPDIPLLIATSYGDLSETLITLDRRQTKYLTRPINLDLLGTLLAQADTESRSPRATQLSAGRCV